MYLIKLYICGIKFNRNKMENEIDLTQFTEGKTVLFDFLKRTIETKIEYDKHLGNNFVRFSDTATGAIELTEDNIRWFNIRLKPTEPESTQNEPNTIAYKNKLLTPAQEKSAVVSVLTSLISESIQAAAGRFFDEFWPQPHTQPEPVKPDTTPQPQTSAVNHPPHYNQYPKEAIDIIIDTFGVSDAIIFCKVNAFKYRLRMGFKGDLLEDFAKEQWYLNKAKELREQVAPFTAAITNEPTTQPPKNESDQPLINPDYFEHPDGTRLYWKGSADGTHTNTKAFRKQKIWVIGGDICREKYPCAIYDDVIQWCLPQFSTWYIASYDYNCKKVYFFDKDTGKCIKTLDNVHLDFELLKPKRNE